MNDIDFTYKDLPHSTNILYAELFRLTILQTPDDSGFSFSSKMIKGRNYWYIKTRVFEKVKDIYFGKDSKEIRHEIRQIQEKWEKGKATIKERKRLVAMLKKGGAFSIPRPFSSYITHLEHSGVFFAGGVIVGSHAFSLYQNLFNVEWESYKLQQTGDLDIAATNHLKIGIPSKFVDTDDAILSSGLEFKRVFNYAFPRSGPTKYVSDRGYEIEFLTPQSGKQITPVKIKRMGIEATPVKHLNYLLKDIRQVVAVNGSGVLVNVPDPAHFAFHKLAISQAVNRNKTKVKKDLSQAECVFLWILDTIPGDLQLAYDDLKKMPRGFQDQFLKGLQVTHLSKRIRNELS